MKFSGTALLSLFAGTATAARIDHVAVGFTPSSSATVGAIPAEAQSVEAALDQKIERDLGVILMPGGNLTVGSISVEVVPENGTALSAASEAAPFVSWGDQNASEAAPEAAVPLSNLTIQGAEPEKLPVLQPSNVTQQEAQVVLQPSNVTQQEVHLSQANASLGTVKVMETSDVLPWYQSNWFSRHMPWTWSLMQTFSFAMVVKAMCMAGNVLVQISPYPQVKKWSNRGDTGETDSAPYLAICFGGWQWCFYGTFAWLVTGQSGFLILVHSNCLGALLGTYYLVVFYKNCRYDISRSGLQKYLTAIAALMVFQAFCILTLPPQRALMLSGLIGSFCSFMGAMSMLVMVPVAIRTKDSRSIPGLLIGANFASALVWCACGWMLGDFMVMGPNIVSVFSSLSCLCLKVIYPSLDDLPRGKHAEFDLQPLSTEETPFGAKMGKMLDHGSLGTSAAEALLYSAEASADTGGTF